jgi:hypothetical protein
MSEAKGMGVRIPPGAPVMFPGGSRARGIDDFLELADRDPFRAVMSSEKERTVELSESN